MRGHKPAQDNRCPAVAKRLRSVPISETMAWALSLLMPEWVLTISTAVRKGARLATKAPSILLCDHSTIEGEAYSQSRNHERLSRDRLHGWEQTNQ